MILTRLWTAIALLLIFSSSALAQVIIPSSGAVSSVTGAGTVTCSPTTGSVVCTGAGAGTTSSYVVLGADAGLTSERVLTGTTNQVVLTDAGAGSTLTLSLPQSIATTSIPQFAGLGIGAAGATGQIIAADGVSVTPSIVFASGTTTGFYWASTNAIAFASGGSIGLKFSVSQIALRSGGSIGFSSSATSALVATDINLVRDGAGILAIQNATNAQQFNVYNTFTDSSNYERLEHSWLLSANTAAIRTMHAGTGTARALAVFYGSTTSQAINIPISSNSPVQISTFTKSAVSASGRVGIGGTVTATSGTHIDLNLSVSGAPTSTSTMVYIPLSIAPTINYSNATPGAGSYEALKIAVTETALPTGQNYLIRASAGAAGTTDMFSVTNTGIAALAGAIGIGGVTPPAAGAGLPSVAFASLGTPANGTVVFCSNCDPVAVLTCTSIGAATGALAFRVAGAWKCAG